MNPFQTAISEDMRATSIRKKVSALLLALVLPATVFAEIYAGSFECAAWDSRKNSWEKWHSLSSSGEEWVIRAESRFIRLRYAGASDYSGDYLLYRISGYDPVWTRLDTSGIRIGSMPEGRYLLEVKRPDSSGNGEVIAAIPLRIRAAFFSGIRAGVILIGSVLLLVFLFLRLRHMALNRDRMKTVKMLENTVQKRTTQLQEVVSHRELLIREIHHRVKNNLQVISALLEMQASRSEDPNVRAAIREGQNRVLSIAFIHQNLYQHDDLKGVEMGSFMHELTSHVRQVFQRPDCPVEVESVVPNVYIDIDSAVPLGLMINELLTNSFKYAFEGRDHGKIRVEMHAEGDGEYSLRYTDDGKGLPPHYDFARSNSLGIKLIRQLSRQLAGHMQYSYQNGACFELKFKNLEARNTML